jgi:four helix bundle protein
MRMRYDFCMYNDNAVRTKSYIFALRIISFCSRLETSKHYLLSKQLMRSGTSIGANIEEALDAQSKPDFISKLSISLNKHVKRIIGSD